MRVVFMGTPEFALPCLDVIKSNHQLCAVVTQPDRRQGRGQRVVFSPVKRWAVENDMPLMQPKRVGEGSFVEWLRNLNVDIIVVVAFGQKIPTSILELAPHGCVNVHGSLLPKYRGAAPINWAIAHGETVTGVSTMYLSEEWDAGDIIYQDSEVIGPTDTAGALHDRLMVKGAALLKRTLQDIARGVAPRIPQNHAAATYATKLTKEDACVNWEKSAQEIDCFVRGMNPWPLAYTYFGDEIIKIHKANTIAGETQRPGEIVDIDPDGIVVGTGEGLLKLSEVQRASSRPMTGRELANGLRLRAKMGFKVGAHCEED